KPLSGAEFKLYATEANAKAHTSELATGVSDSEGKVLYYNSNDEEMKLASGDYYIVETKAPVGYSPYGKVIKISIDATYGDTLVNGTYVTNSPENGYASVDVPNYPITTPKTGGIGTSIFYIVGSALLIGSGIFFFIARKKKRRNTK
ncbi:MAG: SpaA isopeptide-forming pilin-related protein, partial [Ruminococcus sp.]